MHWAALPTACVLGKFTECMSYSFHITMGGRRGAANVGLEKYLANGPESNAPLEHLRINLHHPQLHGLVKLKIAAAALTFPALSSKLGFAWFAA